MPMADVVLLARLQVSVGLPATQVFEGPAAQVLAGPTQVFVSRQGLSGCSMRHP
jgi:hypothetical protein